MKPESVADRGAVWSKFDLGDRVAVVTGGGGLLGGQHADAIAAAGGIPILVDIDGAAAERAASAIAGKHGVDAIGVACDITSQASVDALLALGIARFGRIDILVNNAGSAGPKQPIENLPLSAEELAALQKKGSTDSETVGDALRNIFGVAWNVAVSW